jgi:hypothetical protein
MGAGFSVVDGMAMDVLWKVAGVMSRGGEVPQPSAYGRSEASDRFACA